jgi:hypothetical protein
MYIAFVASNVIFQEGTMLTTLARFSMLAFLLTFSSSLTRADPIVITSGSVSVSGTFIGAPIYSFSGTNFSVIALGSEHGFIGPACISCVSGDVISTSSIFGDGRGTVTINGTTFNNIFILGSLMFTGPTIIMPVTNSTSLTLTAPFTLSGFMEGCLETPLFCRTIVFSTEVSGSGLATIQYEGFVDSQGRTLFEFRNVTYTFTDTTIPEPSSILFLTSGIAALGAAKWKLRRRARFG